MRILAIRGCNLASLAEPFEVDFRKSPLREAGVFAICGPTGAGKSTLLDALCLALYDDTPRLRTALGRDGLPDAAGTTLSPKDPAHLLRRGAAEGEAVVEFLGNDGVAYRARWAVRRARGRVDGRLQHVEMSLVRCDDGIAIGSLKTEVLKEIQARVGLDFAQFTRAVLLAQNEFAAFLKADDDARAALLQTLTGTDTFARISVAVFERARAEKAAHDALARDAARFPVLAPPERAALDDDVRALQARQVGLLAERSLLEAAARWHAMASQLERSFREAEHELAGALSVQADAAARRELLARAEAARGVRSEVSALDAASKEWQEARDALEAAVVAEQAAARDLAAADERLTHAGAAHERAVAASEAQAPALARARELDVRVAERARARDDAARIEAEARKAATDAASELDRLVRSVHDALRRRDEAQAWLDGNASLAGLGEHWSRWDAAFQRATAAMADVREARDGLAGCEQALAAAVAAADAAAKARAEAAEAARAAHLHDDAAQSVLAAFDAHALARERQALEARERLLGQADVVLRDWRTARDRLLDERGALDGAVVDAEQAEVELGRIRGQVPVVESARAQAEQALRRTEAAAADSVGHLRAGLEAGEPCPVCGALEHPWRASTPVFDGLLHGLREDLRACTGQLAALTKAEGGAAERLASARQRVASAERDIPGLVAAQAGAERAWTDLGLQAEAGLGGADDALRWLEEARARNRDAQMASARQASALAKAQADASEAASRRRDADAALDGASRLAEDARGAAGQREAERAAARTRADAESRGLEGVLAELDEALSPSREGGQAGWRAAWLADPEATRVAWQRRAMAWRAQRDARATAAEDARVREGQLAGARQAHAQAEAVLARARGDAAAAADGHAVVLRERAALLDGRAVDVVMADIEASLRGAREQQAEAERVHAKAQLAHTQAQAAALEASRRGERAAAGVDRARAALARRLDAWPMAVGPAPSLDELRAAIAQDEGALVREREALAALDIDVVGARARCGERERQHAAHLATRSDARDEPAVSEALQSVQAALDELAEPLTERLRAQRNDDDNALQQRKVSAAEAAQAEIARTWAQLSELVGSADGKKFRNVAQEVTLDVLLAYANAHLRTLARRYRLERGKDSLALRVVDQDMADERRLVHSLSGGESFLVSLGLALGLASLSSHRVRVESLFIDEGFGSLDPETLRVAMDALDVLQSQGRKVGVISHVPELTERIGTRIEVRKGAGGRSTIVVC